MAIYAFSSSVIANSGGQISNLAIGVRLIWRHCYTTSRQWLASYAAHNTTICEPNSYIDDTVCGWLYFRTWEQGEPPSPTCSVRLFQPNVRCNDPYTNAGDYSDTLPTLMLQADGDKTVPNTVVNNPLIGSAPFAGTGAVS